MNRKKIPGQLKHKIMYDSQYVCCICQQQACQIHHIDGDNSNNLAENLIALCNNHHDEAHTKRQLSQNLNAEALRDAKRNWTEQVLAMRNSAATVTGQLAIAGSSTIASIGITWGYINHRRVGQIARPDLLGLEDRQYFEYCKDRGIIDQKGIPLKPEQTTSSSSYIYNTIYDWHQHGDDQRLHWVYSKLVDQVSERAQPIHLESERFTKTSVIQLVNPGDFIFLDRSFYFKCIQETQENQHRHVRTFKRKVSVEFYIDTINMFGTTSISISFSGHKTCAAFLQIKSIEEMTDGKLVLHCTPIALGVGFNKQQ